MFCIMIIFSSILFEVTLPIRSQDLFLAVEGADPSDYCIPYQGSTLTFETSGPPGPPDANSTRPNSNLGSPV